MLNLTYQYKLALTKQQQQTYDEWLETSRRVWNYALAERKDWYKSRACPIDRCSLRGEYIIPPDAPRPSFSSQCKALTQARKVYPELALAHAQISPQPPLGRGATGGLRRLEKAFVSMWERGHGFPRFKKPGRLRSLLFPQLGKDPVRGNRVKLPGVGWVKMRLSRAIPEGFVVKQAQVVKRASGWYVMLTLQCEIEVPDIVPHGEALGIDVGLSNYLATSAGELVPRPRFFVDLQSKLKLLQQRVSQKVKGSNNWRKAHHKVAKLHEYIRNCRQDFFYKLAHRLCDDVGMVFAEKLNFKAWARGMFSKHTLDAAHGEFLRILKWVCWKRGVFYAEVDAKGTSQICPSCGTNTGKKELSVRVHQCPECGYTTDRDIAAAQVVVQRGLAAVGQTVKMFGEGLSVGSP
ncbi:RNA-guided endonuclease InsQ/TnpB family protein [Baaleninema simplex]|uniref:RNA-guided endonuclease InsQ/TnpB family protein n=1 Tax=Baaleninema simplex TaxID=2862350 RepID=UPI000349B656|nr:RNA-guided endonuclease TnpB family protein [Baaleninema simplex]